MGKRALDRKPVVAPSAVAVRTTTVLTTDGYVRVHGELWRAISTVPEGEDVEMVEVRKLTLHVSTVQGNHKGW